MLHHVFGRKLNRTANERKRLFKNLIRSLVVNGKISTTLAKAKAVQPGIEKLVTRAKITDLVSRRFLLKQINDEAVVDKLLTEIGPLFKNVNGGYTRIIKSGKRFGDNAQSVLFTFTKNVTNSAVTQVKKLEEKTVNKKETGESNAKNKTNKNK